MRKISLIPYQCENGQLYEVQKSLSAMLFLPSLQLSARDVIEHDRIARKIETGGDEVLLEEAEYAKLKKAFETFTGFSRNDLELVTRVMDAPEVPIKEA